MILVATDAATPNRINSKKNLLKLEYLLRVIIFRIINIKRYKVNTNYGR